VREWQEAPPGVDKMEITSLAAALSGDDRSGRSDRTGRSGKLRDVIAYPTRRKWRVFKLLGAQPTVHLDAGKFGSDLCAVLNSYYKCSVEAVEHQRSLWAQVTVTSLVHASNYNELVAMVHPPHSPYLFMVPIKNREIEPIMIQALCTLFNCPRLSELQLFGNDIDTLKDLALQKLSQGAFHSYRLCATLFDNSPGDNVALVAKRRRAVIDKVLSEDKRQGEEEALEGTERNKVVLKTDKRKPEHRFTTQAVERGGEGGEPAHGEPGARGRGAIDRGDTNDDGAGELDASSKFATVCLASTSDLLLPDGRGKVKDFSCFVRLQGSDVMAGLEGLYGNDLVVPGKEIPAVLDINNLLTKHLSRALGAPAKRARPDEAEPTDANRVLWMQTI
jgi:hypothetical protein